MVKKKSDMNSPLPSAGINRGHNLGYKLEIEAAKKEGKRQIDNQMLADSFPIEMIVTNTGLSEVEIKKGF